MTAQPFRRSQADGQGPPFRPRVRKVRCVSSSNISPGSTPAGHRRRADSSGYGVGRGPLPAGQIAQAGLVYTLEPAGTGDRAHGGRGASEQSHRRGTEYKFLDGVHPLATHLRQVRSEFAGSHGGEDAPEPVFAVNGTKGTENELKAGL